VIDIPGADGPHFTVDPLFRLVHPDLGVVDISDRLLSIDQTASMDEAAGRLTVKLARGGGTDSLSPLVAASTYNAGTRPALDPNLNVFLGYSIAGNSPADIFTGRLDGIDVGGSKGEVTIRCRDEAGFYLNRTINSSSIVASDSAENVMSAVLQLGGFSGTELITPVSPGWTVNEYIQEEMSVMEALRRIAQQFGWDVRYFKSDGGIVFYDPNRPLLVNIWPPGTVRFVTDATIGPDRYTDVTELAWGDDDVRNYWEGWWRDPTTGLPQTTTPVQDAASIARYGLRYARIYLDRASNITDATEMTRFLTAALLDTKDPFASHKVTMPFYPSVELNDFHTYLANGDEYDSDVQVAVVGYTHHWDSTPGSQPTTTIATRATSIGAYREYRRSIPPKTIVTTVAPTTEYAPEGTVVYVKAA
jgi:hypothetical protein